MKEYYSVLSDNYGKLAEKIDDEVIDNVKQTLTTM